LDAEFERFALWPPLRTLSDRAERLVELTRIIERIEFMPNGERPGKRYYATLHHWRADDCLNMVWHHSREKVNQKAESRHELSEGIDWWIPSFMRGRLMREEVESGFVSHSCDTAIKDFAIVLEVDPTNAWAFLGRAEAWNGLGVEKNMREDLSRALAIFDRAIEANPRDRSSLVARAFTLAKLGRRAKAISDLEESLLLTPKDAAGSGAFSESPIHPIQEPDWLTERRREVTERRISVLRDDSADWLLEWSWPPR
jgi:hypothetical protein